MALNNSKPDWLERSELDIDNEVLSLLNEQRWAEMIADATTSIWDEISPEIYNLQILWVQSVDELLEGVR